MEREKRMSQNLGRESLARLQQYYCFGESLATLLWAGKLATLGRGGIVIWHYGAKKLATLMMESLVTMGREDGLPLPHTGWLVGQGYFVAAANTPIVSHYHPASPPLSLSRGNTRTVTGYCT